VFGTDFDRYQNIFVEIDQIIEMFAHRREAPKQILQVKNP